MSKRNFEILSKALGILKTISFVALIVLPFFYGKDLFYFVKEFANAIANAIGYKKDTVDLDFFIVAITISCFFFPPALFAEVEKLVLNELDKIEKDKEVEFQANKKACNLYVK